MKYIKSFENILDTYANKKFGILPNYLNINNLNAKPVAHVTDYSKSNTLIFKNPKNLNDFDSKVRAIGSINGDLYVAQKNKYFTHNDMAKALRLIDDNNDIYDLNEQYVVLYRISNTNTFSIGESTNFLNVNPKYKIVSETILQNIKRKNPQFNFINEVKQNESKENKEKYVIITSNIYDWKLKPYALKITKTEDNKIFYDKYYHFSNKIGSIESKETREDNYILDNIIILYETDNENDVINELKKYYEDKDFYNNHLNKIIALKKYNL